MYVVQKKKTLIQITKILLSEKGRQIELCFSYYEDDKFKSDNTKFKKNLDLKFETIALLKLSSLKD